MDWSGDVDWTLIVVRTWIVCGLDVDWSVDVDWTWIGRGLE